MATVGGQDRTKRFPSAFPGLLRDEAKVVGWIAELTRQPEASVRARLREESLHPGTEVARGSMRAGVEPYVWSEALSRFYERSDAFLYELAVWNANLIKCRMRRWVGRCLEDYCGGEGDVLSYGDGLGFDSAYLALAGYNVTYLDVPGYTESFARRVFAESCTGRSIVVLNEVGRLDRQAYDVVLCLDVLEHVPDPSALVRMLVEALRPGGLFVVHAPFYMIHPTNPTHLKANRRHSGSLSLYRSHGLRLVTGQFGWNPLVWEKAGGSLPPRRAARLRVLGLRVAGLYLAMGRFSNLPFGWVDSYRRRHNRWLTGDRGSIRSDGEDRSGVAS
jgi:SAM-dependent methyltransferase